MSVQLSEKCIGFLLTENNFSIQYILITAFPLALTRVFFLLIFKEKMYFVCNCVDVCVVLYGYFSTYM